MNDNAHINTNTATTIFIDIFLNSISNSQIDTDLLQELSNLYIPLIFRQKY